MATPGARSVRRAALAVAVLSGALAGCGGDDDRGDERPTGSTATTTAGGTEAGAEAQVVAQAFLSRPDITPPTVTVETPATAAAEPGYLFLAPKQAGAQTGPVIMDDAGRLVWAAPNDGTVADFRVQEYRGEPVLTWYEGSSLGGYGEGEFVIADASYREVARVAAGNGRKGDLHEFQLTDEGTALVLTYDVEPADLREVGGPADGFAFDNHVQEVDVATGEVLFEWSAGDHVPVTDTMSELVPDAAATEDELDDDGTEEAPFDWFHVNSVAEDGDDTLLVSARNTHAVYAIDRSTGDVRWTLGGRSSDFTMGDGATFAWQHDARRLPDGTLGLFDNQAAPATADESRGLVLDVDPEAGEATVVREVTHPDGVLAGSQGNMQVLPGGNVLVGWGSQGRVSEFSPDDEMVFDATWAPADSYRVYRFPWVGAPATVPDVAVRPAEGTDGRAVEVAVSWNGATEVARWQVLGGDAPDALAPHGATDRQGFETTITVDAADHVAVEALGADGEVLATSEPVAVG